MKTRLTLTVANGVAVLFLSFLMQETHELAHTAVGRAICGCWGRRDFNLWTLCGGCGADPLSLLATFAGPLYSFAVIWTGYTLMARASVRARSIGLALIVASMPLSRVLTPLIGGGDEVHAFGRLLGSHEAAWMLSVALVLALAIPPMLRVLGAIGAQGRLRWFLGLAFGPFLATGLVVFGGLQASLLRNGVLSGTWILGSPALVTLWFAICVLVCAATARRLATLLAEVAPSDDGPCDASTTPVMHKTT